MGIIYIKHKSILITEWPIDTVLAALFENETKKNLNKIKYLYVYKYVSSSGQCLLNSLFNRLVYCDESFTNIWEIALTVCVCVYYFDAIKMCVKVPHTYDYVYGYRKWNILPDHRTDRSKLSPGHSKRKYC